MNDISIDIETLSTKPNALITQIGACAFDRNSGAIDERVFLANCQYVDPWPSDLDYHVDPSTALWWIMQSEEARMSLSKPEPRPIGDALNDLSNWMRQVGFVSQHRSITMRVWANAPTFDLTILRYALAKNGLHCPWHYRQEHCMRTVCTLARELIDGDPITVSEEGLVAHRADHDAIRQARIISEATRILNGN
jgi:hypothetical protein